MSRKEPIPNSNIIESATSTCKILTSSGMGMIIGGLTSFAVVSTLGEISTNEFFSFYFGLLFIIVGVLLFFRSFDTKYRQLVSAKPRILMAIAIVIILSGISSIVLEKNIFSSLKPTTKVPLYGLLGVTLAFAIIFSLIDIINYIAGFCMPSYSKAIVDSKQQFTVIILLSCIMGFLYGIIFGILDLEDANQYNFAYLIVKDVRLSLPIGCVLGFFGGFYNEYHRQGGSKYDNFSQINNFDEDL